MKPRTLMILWGACLTLAPAWLSAAGVTGLWSRLSQPAVQGAPKLKTTAAPVPVKNISPNMGWVDIVGSQNPQPRIRTATLPRNLDGGNALPARRKYLLGPLHPSNLPPAPRGQAPSGSYLERDPTGPRQFDPLIKESR